MGVGEFTPQRITPEDLERRKQELIKQFPGAKFGWLPDVKPPCLELLLSALTAGGEEDIQKVLTANPYLIQYAVKSSGHHGIYSPCSICCKNLDRSFQQNALGIKFNRRADVDLDGHVVPEIEKSNA